MTTALYCLKEQLTRRTCKPKQTAKEPIRWTFMRRQKHFVQLKYGLWGHQVDRPADCASTWRHRLALGHQKNVRPTPTQGETNCPSKVGKYAT